MDVLALIVSIVAVVVTAVSVWYARGQKRAAVRSAGASEQSATESRRSANAAERSASAAEEAVGYQRAEAERNRVKFELEHQRGDTYLLCNRGTDSAYGVRLDFGDLLTRVDKTEFDEFPAGHTIDFIASRAMGTRQRHVTVTWHLSQDCSDGEKDARLYLPNREQSPRKGSR